MSNKLSVNTHNNLSIFCLAYVVGLLSTSFLGFPNLNATWLQEIVLILSLVLLSLSLAIFVPRFRFVATRAKIWLIAGTISILAVIYLQVRIPYPGVNDISNILNEKYNKNPVFIVEGKVLSQAKLTASQRIQFWFKAKQLNQFNNKQLVFNKTVTGKLYVTVPLSQGMKFYPGQKLVVSGVLYLPRSASNPSSFDFKSYLSRHGTFAGLKGLKILKKEEPPWGFWKLRQRITAAQVHWLGEPEGLLVSSIVLGKQAVNLPSAIREQFTKAGLSHVLVASGFQISILLGVVITLTKRFSPKNKFIIGLIILLFYVGLTGVDPSIMRAALMGIGALFALVTDRKIRIFGAFLGAGTLLLLLNPLWIWDLSFQLSFLATLGLIVTMPTLEKKLDWLPPAIATLIATPLAASIWTLPLLIYVFKTVAIYSILINIITAPLIIVISLVGMLSAVTALVLPVGGSAIAWILYYPTHLLIVIVRFFITLPGSFLTVGQIPIISLCLIYSLICLVWFSKFWQRRWWIVGLFTVSLVTFPIIYKQLTLVQVTVLSTVKEPVLVIQERGTVILINSGDAATAKYTVMPFLNQQGINQVDCALAFKSSDQRRNGWSEIQNDLSIKHFFSNLDKQQNENEILRINNKILTGLTTIQLLSNAPPILQLKIQKQTWLLLASRPEDVPRALQKQSVNSRSFVFLWPGQKLSKEWLENVNPKVAIATSNFVSETTRKQLQQQQIKLYWLRHNGTIQWTPKQGFQSVIKGTDQYTF